MWCLFQIATSICILDSWLSTTLNLRPYSCQVYYLILIYHGALDLKSGNAIATVHSLWLKLFAATEPSCRQPYTGTPPFSCKTYTGCGVAGLHSTRTRCSCSKAQCCRLIRSSPFPPTCSLRNHVSVTTGDIVDCQVLAIILTTTVSRNIVFVICSNRWQTMLEVARGYMELIKTTRHSCSTKASLRRNWQCSRTMTIQTRRYAGNVDYEPLPEALDLQLCLVICVRFTLFLLHVSMCWLDTRRNPSWSRVLQDNSIVGWLSGRFRCGQ